jgi:hypothetical protein
MRSLSANLVLLPVLVASCLEMEQTITIAADGSGTQRVVLSLPAGTEADLRAKAEASQTGAADPGALFDRKTMEKELVAGGLTLRSHEVEKIGSGRRVAMEVGFDTFDGLTRSPLTGSQAEWTIESGPLPDTLMLTLYPQGKEAWVAGRRRAQGVGDDLDPVELEFFRRQQERFQGLDLSLRFELPGTVLRHTRNMKRIDQRTVVASIQGKDIRTPQDLIRRLAPRYQVVFAGKGCSIQTDGDQ